MTYPPERAELERLHAAALEIARSGPSDRARLLDLLRTLERAHREIREGLFQAALPGSRRELYQFLREIEERGGWPYIPRMSIQHLLAHLAAAESRLDRPDTDGDKLPPSA